MTGFFILGAAVFVGYRPSNLAAFAIAITAVSILTTAYAAGLMTQASNIMRRARLVAAHIDAVKVAVAEGATKDDQEKSRRNLLSKVLDAPLLSCATDSDINEAVHSALGLLQPLEEEFPSNPNQFSQ
jgi:hypothetical protein